MTRSPMSVRLRAPAEYRWSETFCLIELELCAELNRRFGGDREPILVDEVRDLETCRRSVLEAADDNQKLEREVEALLEAKEGVNLELGKVKDGCNRLFATVLGNTNELVDRIRF